MGRTSRRSTARWRPVAGVVIEGYRVASGASSESPYSAGSITLQVPRFRERGLDLSGYFPATLNIRAACKALDLTNPRYTFRNVVWTDHHGPEDFSFSPCEVEYHDTVYSGLIYYPHPSTKPGHQHPPNVVEVITKRIEGVEYGHVVTLYVDTSEVAIVE